MIQLDDDGDIVRQVILESTLATHGLADSLGADDSRVYAVGKIMVQAPGFPEIAGEKSQRAFLQVGTRVYPEGMHLAGSDLANPPECLDREFGDKGGSSVGMYRVKPVRLLVIGSNLRENLL